MDIITLFQALLNAWGLSFNATQYAQHSTYVVTKQDVDRWWESQTTSFKNKWSKLAMPSRMMLWAMGESDFVNTMNNLQDYLKENPNVPYRTADQFMDAYATALNSAQQNSINYTKDSVTKTAYNITSEILDITKQIAKAVTKPVVVVDCRTFIDNYIHNTLGLSWNVNWDIFTKRLEYMLSKYDSSTYRYIHIFRVYLNNNDILYNGIGIYLSNSQYAAEHFRSRYEFISPNDKTSTTNFFPTLVDATILYNDYGSYAVYNGMYNDSADFTYYSNMIVYDTIDVYNPGDNAKWAQVTTYNLDTKSVVTTSIAHNADIKVIDRLGGTSKSYAIVKDVVGVGQTIIGVTNDRADDSDDRVLIMNAEGVETLARADAGAYPEVLPSTIAAQIVDIGASVTDAVSDIANKNPEYPYVPPTPIVNSTGNNLFTLYNVTPTEMSNLADYLWSTNFIDSFKKFFSNPSDSLISLVGYPVDVKSSGAKNIKIGYTDSGVSSHAITDYIQEFDLGSVYIPKFYNNFLDNNPYTKVSIYLPFIGSCSLDSDIVVGATIKIKYRVELLTANCVALLSVSNINGTYPIYQFNGNLGMQFPLSSGSYASIYKNLISTGISAVAAYASGGALTPLAIASAANTVVGSKSEVSKSGNMNGSSGYCGILKPYVIVERPVTDIPGSYAKYNGVVTNMSLSIGSLQGYCVMENVDVSTIPCSESERAEITNLLLNGFFV